MRNQNKLIEGLLKSKLSDYWKEAVDKEHPLMLDVSSAMSELIDLLAPEWVSIKERFPEKGGRYIIYGRYAKDTPMRAFEASYEIKQRRFRTDIWSKDVTHWMPLPIGPPKQ